MPFFVIRGTFHIKGYSPDGDSIRFHAHNEDNWHKLSGSQVRLNGRRHAQLRLEAIDTLETHFRDQHQPMALATRALEFLLAGLGITGLQTDAAWARAIDAADGTEGYIVSRAVEKNGRPVAFVFPRIPSEDDGAQIFLTPDRMRKSVNYQSLAAGLAYPTYYSGLFSDLRRACTKVVRKVRQDSLGVWAEDRTNKGFAVESMESITERYVILPKLFRRLVEYLEGGGSVAGFKEFLALRAEPVLIISTAHATHLDNVVEVNNNIVRMIEPPENLMFF